MLEVQPITIEFYDRSFGDAELIRQEVKWRRSNVMLIVLWHEEQR